MKIAVIHYRSTPTLSGLELLNAIKETGHEPVYLRIHELDAYLLNNRVVVKRFVDEVELDGAIVRSLGLTLTIDTFMKRIGVLKALASRSVVINNPELIVFSRDKWNCLLKLAQHNIPVPDTFITENPYAAKRFNEASGVTVYKPLMGSLGLGSTLVKDPDIAYHITRSLLNISLPSYFQKFLNKPGYDFRVFVVGGRVVGAMKRISSSWKTNIAQGAVGEAVSEREYPDVYDIAVKTSNILGYDYSGVDIAYDQDSGKYYVLEVNVFPQWQGLKTATGRDIARDIVSYLVEKIRR